MEKKNDNTLWIILAALLVCVGLIGCKALGRTALAAQAGDAVRLQKMAGELSLPSSLTQVRDHLPRALLDSPSALPPESSSESAPAPVLEAPSASGGTQQQAPASPESETSSAPESAAPSSASAAPESPSSASSAPSSASQTPSSAPEASSSAVETPASSSETGGASDNAAAADEQLSIMAYGKVMTGGALDLLSRIVDDEMGSPYHKESLKALTVAVYSVIKNYNARGQYPTFYPNDSADPVVVAAVREVLGQAVYYNGSYANTPFFAISCGVTTSSKNVWGYAYPYLISVDSSIDTTYSKYQVDKTVSSAQMAEKVRDALGVDLTAYSSDPSAWLEIQSRTDGLYVGALRVGDTVITGRRFREGVLGLRSAAFDIRYDAASDCFTVTTYGYGHGVGMSAIGAHLYASREGWDYLQILAHYYPGTTVK